MIISRVWGGHEDQRLKNAGTDTEAGAVVMSLPVSAVAGFGMLDNLDNGEN